MADDPFAEVMAAWRKATDTYIQAWGRAFEAAMDTEAGKTAVQEMRDTYLGTQNTLNSMTRQAGEPIVAMAGGVPMSEFRRLADQVQTILMRLDRIDDALHDIRSRLDAMPELHDRP